MKKLTLLLSFLTLARMGFSQQTLTVSLTHDGQQRQYILYVPAAYTGNEPVPLVFNFHGYTSNATEQLWYGDFRPIADTAGFLVVHPEGTLLNGSAHWNVGGWTLGSTTDDVGFTQAMIDSLSVQYNIDPERIYATGMSNGGYMSFLLACQLGNKIAAIASVTGSMTPETYNACTPAHPTPVLQIHGTNDGTVPYTGAIWTKSIDEVMAYWQNYNNCQPVPSLTPVPNAVTWDGSTVEHFVYSGGDNQVNTEHFKITGGGHTWPGSVVPLPATNYDINASAEIWKFFSRYDLNGLIDATTALDPRTVAGQIQAYPNPTTGRITVRGAHRQATAFRVLSLQGQAMMAGTLFAAEEEVDLSPLPAGLYFLKIGDHILKVWKR
jgi:polyhydroxybutyrate depolymerase